jgi:hypothetical protein
MSGIAGIVIFTTALSGIYPSLFLSSLRPVQVLGGIHYRSFKRNFVRQFLVIFQFSISIFLLIAALVVTRQLRYIHTKNLGYERDHILYVQMQGDMKERIDALKIELNKNSNILSSSASSELIVDVGRNYRGLQWEGKQEEDIHFGMLSVDFDYLETMGMKISDGRFFSKEFTSDAGQTYILNETAVEVMGLKSPVGKWMEWGPRGTIVGVVKDFHFRSLQYNIVPIFLIISPERFEYLVIRVGSTGAALQETLNHIENVWNAFAPEFPFEFHFLDEAFDNMYRKEVRIARLFRTFTFLAIFISCLGLFGLASFMTEQRTREVGIRKVLGSSISQILLHYSLEFIKWVAIANLVSWPFAYVFMRKWLGNYAYRAPMTLGLFIISGLIALLIALFTVSHQLIKAARINPVDSLRYE